MCAYSTFELDFIAFDNDFYALGRCGELTKLGTELVELISKRTTRSVRLQAELSFSPVMNPGDDFEES